MSGPRPGPVTRYAGTRLREEREERGMSLADVEERTGGRHKAVVSGMRETGYRGMTLDVLAEMAEFYRMPMTAFLPDGPPTLAGAAYVAITAAHRTQREHEAARYEAEIAELRSENAMLRAQTRENVA